MDNFPRSLYGIFNNAIPEENEDDSDQTSLQSFHGGSSEEITAPKESQVQSDFKQVTQPKQDPIKTDFIITNEVMKLGLTATLEPFWVESRPKLRGRRHGSEHSHGHKHSETSESGSSHRNSVGKLEHLELKDLEKRKHIRKRHSLDLSQSIECKSKTSQNQNENSHFCDGSLKDSAARSSSIDSVNSIDDGKIFSDIECDIFKRNESVRRASSIDCLRKIQDTVKLPLSKDLEINGQIDGENKGEVIGLRRVSSTSDLRKTIESTNISGEAAQSDLEKNKEIVSKDDMAIETSKISTLESHEYLHEKRYSLRPRSKTTASVIKWARSNKVRHSKRENNMCSPTSF